MLAGLTNLSDLIPQFSAKLVFQNYYCELKQNWEQALHDLVPKGSPEQVHRVRVLSRRLRALTALLQRSKCSPESKKLRQSLQNTTRHLGDLRSWEVSSLLLKKLSGDKKFLKKLQQIIKKEISWKKVQQAFARQARALRKQLIPKPYSQRKKTLAALPAPDFLFNLVEDEALECALAHEYQKRSEKLKEEWASFEKNRNLESLHPFRIALKKWRYTLELWKLSGHPKVDPILGQLKTWQEALGELNDLQVLRDQLKTPGFKKQLKKTSAKSSSLSWLSRKALRKALAQELKQKMTQLPHQLEGVFP